MSATAQVHISAESDRAVREARVLNVTIESDERLLLSVVEAARRLGIGRTLMHELIGTGQIRSVHVGRLRKVPTDALEAYVAALRRVSDPA